MEELFQHLELRIQKLLQKFEYLKASNQRIQQSKRIATQEKEQLLLKQQGAVTQIENMIVRLKTLEG